MPFKEKLDKLADLRAQLKMIVKDQQAGKLSNAAAAEKIIQTTENIQAVIEELRKDGHHSDD